MRRINRGRSPREPYAGRHHPAPPGWCHKLSMSHEAQGKDQAGEQATGRDAAEVLPIAEAVPGGSQVV